MDHDRIRSRIVVGSGLIRPLRPGYVDGIEGVPDVPTGIPYRAARPIGFSGLIVTPRSRKDHCIVPQRMLANEHL